MEAYLARFEPDCDAGGYVVTFPDFGYGATQGETDAEAMEMAKDLLMLTIADTFRNLGRCLSRAVAGAPPVSLPALQSAKADLYIAFLGSELN